MMLRIKFVGVLFSSSLDMFLECVRVGVFLQRIVALNSDYCCYILSAATFGRKGGHFSVSNRFGRWTNACIHNRLDWRFTRSGREK